jgi:hypothetical protein|nr:hypothetical protein [Candidatus Krumholzibacteria bacterium]
MQQLKIIQDRFGRLWLGPENTDPDEDLAKQGCWRCQIPHPLWSDWFQKEPTPDPEETPSTEGKVECHEKNPRRGR